MTPAAGAALGGGLAALLEPTHLIALIVVALLLGQAGWRASRDALLAFAFALALGLALAAAGRGGHADAPLLVLAAAGGLLVSIGRPWPLPLLGAIAAAAGGGIGLGAAAEAGTPQLLALAGSFVAACLGVAAGAWLAALAQQRPWGRILVRVAGSWMAAAALLVLALLYAHG